MSVTELFAVLTFKSLNPPSLRHRQGPLKIVGLSQPRRRVLPVGGALSEAASAGSAVLAAPHVHLRFLSEVLVAQELRVGLTISQISR